MSKDDFITLWIAGLPRTVTAERAGRTVRLVTRGSWYLAQELSGKKVMHEVQARVKETAAIEKRFRNGSTSGSR